MNSVPPARDIGSSRNATLLDASLHGLLLRTTGIFLPLLLPHRHPSAVADAA